MVFKQVTGFTALSTYLCNHDHPSSIQLHHFQSFFVDSAAHLKHTLYKNGKFILELYITYLFLLSNFVAVYLFKDTN